VDCKNGWVEEEIVDFVLDRLPVEKQEALERHVECCDSCRGVLTQWQEVLSDGTGEMVSTAPSPGVKRKLMKRIRPRKVPFGASARKPLIVLTAAAAMFFILMASGMFSVPPNHSEIRYVNGKPNIATTGGTRNIHYVQVSDRDIHAYILVNRTTNELLLYLDGLPAINGKDYQAWLVTNGRFKDAGLLRVNHGMGRLYFHGSQMARVRHIVVSVEPKGGSESQTGPKTFMIEMNRQR
jgi:anti-sigma-K factor RskA